MIEPDFDKYRSLPADPNRDSPRRTYGAPYAHLIGDYWTEPVTVRVDDLRGLRAVAVSKDRLTSIQKADVDGVELPPIEIGVFKNGSGWIVDGNHRLVAARRAGTRTVQVIFTFV